MDPRVPGKRLERRCFNETETKAEGRSDFPLRLVQVNRGAAFASGLSSLVIYRFELYFEL